MNIKTSNVLTLRIRYIYSRSGKYYFQKAVPGDLRDKYKGKTIKVPLGTTSPHELAKLAEHWNSRLEAEFNRLRDDPTASPASLKSHAKAYLQQWGLAPGYKPLSGPYETTPLDLLYAHLDDKRVAYAENAFDEGLFSSRDEAYKLASAKQYLSPVELQAVKLLNGEEHQTFGEDAFNLYIADSGKASKQKFVSDARRAVESFLSATGGDRPIEQVTREDVKAYIKAELTTGKKTTTIRRRLKSLRAIYAHWLREKEIERSNPFSELKIEGEGEDSKKRNTLPPASLQVLTEECRKADDDMRWLLALLADTGMRLAEGAGLLLSDLVLNADIPHISLKPHKWRSLKTTNSTRDIPLVGVALWAAKRIKQSAHPGQIYAFPRYCDGIKTSATSASNALNKWMQGKGIHHTCHEFRHTMADRLREVQAPTDIIDLVLGWASKAQRNTYGRGYGLRACHEWMLKVERVDEPSSDSAASQAKVG